MVGKANLEITETKPSKNREGKGIDITKTMEDNVAMMIKTTEQSYSGSNVLGQNQDSDSDAPWLF